MPEACNYITFICCTVCYKANFAYICIYFCAYCIGDCCVDISDIITDMEELDECACVTGDVVIDLSGQTSLVQNDFRYLDNLTNVTGIFSLKNVALSSRTIEIRRLQHIGGNSSNMTHNSALRVLNVSGGDIIFPKLAVITRGDVEFQIDNEVCGFRGINWSSILCNGSKINKSNTCEGKSYYAEHTIVYICRLVLPY